MELSSNEEGEIPLPISSTYVGAHMIHHQMNNTIMPSSVVPQIPTNNGPLDNQKKPPVKYRECLKNHAASMGGNATDGCGEFMPSGDDGTLEALTCSACNCHRNFHRKETESDAISPSPFDHYFNRPRKLLLGHPKSALGADYPTAAIVPPRGGAGPPHHHHHMMMSYNVRSDQSDEQEDGGGVVIARPMHQMARKRFRTKFSVEQKEKMLNFAEKVGWKIQKQEESVVQQFCQEIGVKRRVLKVWMHNNKHNLAKKMINNNHNNNNHNPSLSLPTATAATTTATH